MRNRLLSVVWYIKVFFALGIAVGGIAFLSQRVFRLHTDKLNESKNSSVAISIDSGNVECQTDLQPRKRIEPPDGEIYIGFHLNWQETTPVQAAGLIGRNPAIMYCYFLTV